MFAFAPVIAGDWKQHELWDGTYDLNDLLDWHEYTNVKHMNERILREWQASQQHSDG
jgi:hypothetical protein